MNYTVKTLLSQGKSIREIAKDLGMCRNTISRIKMALDNGKDSPDEQVRTKTFDGYKDLINEYFEDGLTALLIHRRLTTEKGLIVLKKQEVSGSMPKVVEQGCFFRFYACS